MEGRYIIPVEPANDGGEVVVVEVQQEGSHPLDVRLVGCEGESPYVTQIKHRNIAKLKHKFKGTDHEWETVLFHFLLQKQPEGDGARILENVRMVYALKGDNIEISVRQDVKGIKVTLGEILLPRDDGFEFNPFEWAQVSAQAHSQTLRKLVDLKSRVSSEQDTIAKLNAQLDDFIKTKTETETAMLQQFMELLNEKKRKIRDQSRLLATAKVDKSAATTIKSTREETKPRRAGASRASKRKAPAKAPEPEEPEQLSDADQMEIDQAKAEEQDDEEEPEAVTPDRSDEETEAEEEGAEGAVASSALQTRDRSSETAQSQSTVAQPPKDAPSEAGGPPPQRELPFGRPAMRSKPPEKKPPPATADEDEETEDEEL
ncbi:hypothetical protein BU26DRAFT_264273 [Trematosphaeria pertusa]|uniref:Uncharacterized protein n=1 Tax=Trematosphaeria pertusa TaxID=390896 RepID=A0A6A6IJA5_9PLEO|nr:uncharacterized protein BU26DRAFT_264273 [Trematosphaeria pertusa]KAF2250491.1 hypothetical protein BU26DRAFT_264273 [Trematosphaeria pertusa]